MFEFLFYITMIVSVVALGSSYREHGTSDRFMLTVVYVVGVWCIILAPVMVMYTQAAGYQAVINKQGPIVQKYRDYLKRLESKIESKQVMFTANHDTPVKSFIEAHLKTEKELLGAELAVNKAEIDLERIRLGLCGFVVRWL